MSDGKIEITFSCPQCGGGTISVEDTDRDDSKVSCANTDCGAQFDQTWGEIKEAAKQRAKDAVLGSMRDMFKRAAWKTG